MRPIYIWRCDTKIVSTYATDGHATNFVYSHLKTFVETRCVDLITCGTPAAQLPLLLTLGIYLTGGRGRPRPLPRARSDVTVFRPVFSKLLGDGLIYLLISLLKAAGSDNYAPSRLQEAALEVLEAILTVLTDFSDLRSSVLPSVLSSLLQSGTLQDIALCMPSSTPMEPAESAHPSLHPSLLLLESLSTLQAMAEPLLRPLITIDSSAHPASSGMASRDSIFDPVSRLLALVESLVPASAEDSRSADDALAAALRILSNVSKLCSSRHLLLGPLCGALDSAVVVLCRTGSKGVADASIALLHVYSYLPEFGDRIWSGCRLKSRLCEALYLRIIDDSPSGISSGSNSSSEALELLCFIFYHCLGEEHTRRYCAAGEVDLFLRVLEQQALFQWLLRCLERGRFLGSVLRFVHVLACNKRATFRESLCLIAQECSLVFAIIEIASAHTDSLREAALHALASLCGGSVYFTWEVNVLALLAQERRPGPNPSLELLAKRRACLAEGGDSGAKPSAAVALFERGCRESCIAARRKLLLEPLRGGEDEYPSKIAAVRLLQSLLSAGRDAADCALRATLVAGDGSGNGTAPKVAATLLSPSSSLLLMDSASQLIGLDALRGVLQLCHTSSDGSADLHAHIDDAIAAMVALTYSCDPDVAAFAVESVHFACSKCAGRVRVIVRSQAFACNLLKPLYNRTLYDNEALLADARSDGNYLVMLSLSLMAMLAEDSSTVQYMFISQNGLVLSCALRALSVETNPSPSPNPSPNPNPGLRSPYRCTDLARFRGDYSVDLSLQLLLAISRVDVGLSAMASSGELLARVVRLLVGAGGGLGPLEVDALSERSAGCKDSSAPEIARVGAIVDLLARLASVTPSAARCDRVRESLAESPEAALLLLRLWYHGSDAALGPLLRFGVAAGMTVQERSVAADGLPWSILLERGLVMPLCEVLCAGAAIAGATCRVSLDEASLADAKDLAAATLLRLLLRLEVAAAAGDSRELDRATMLIQRYADDSGLLEQLQTQLSVAAWLRPSGALLLLKLLGSSGSGAAARRLLQTTPLLQRCIELVEAFDRAISQLGLKVTDTTPQLFLRKKYLYIVTIT